MEILFLCDRIHHDCKFNKSYRDPCHFSTPHRQTTWLEEPATKPHYCVYAYLGLARDIPINFKEEKQ